jgi:hypothetical protein
MKQYFKTKTDINGNTYTLEIDHDAKTYSENRLPAPDAVIIGKRERIRMMDELKRNGYTCHIYIYR